METRINNIKCKQMYFKKRGKNLLKNTAVSQTINGVTFTVNEDGSITVNGTATDLVQYNVSANNKDTGQSGYVALCSDAYILTGCPKGGSNDTYYLKYHEWDNSWIDMSVCVDSGNGTIISHKDDPYYVYVRIVIKAGYTANNLTFYPMIRRADIADATYEPYEDFVPYKKVYVDGVLVFSSALDPITTALRAYGSNTVWSSYTNNWYANAYDLTDVKKITIYFKCHYTDTQSNGGAENEKWYYNAYEVIAGVSSNKSSYAKSSTYMYGQYSYTPQKTTNNSFTIDVSALKGNYYIGIGSRGGSIMSRADWGDKGYICDYLESYGTQTMYGEITKVEFVY